MDEPPQKFFTKLLHAPQSPHPWQPPAAQWNEVDSRAGSLELFVRDLLSVELLERIPD